MFPLKNLSISSLLTDEIALVKSCFLAVPYPTTTISSKALVSSESTTRKFVFPLIDNCLSTYPIKVIFKVASELTVRVKAPSISDIVPLLVPFSIMLAPTIGSFRSSTTTPFIVTLDWLMS